MFPVESVTAVYYNKEKNVVAWNSASRIIYPGLMWELN